MMGSHIYFGPSVGATDEWYTPRYLFDALQCRFDLDVSAPRGGPRHVPADSYLTVDDNALTHPWHGFVWMNPPFGGRNGLVPWLDRFFQHGNGIALTPDRTSAPWWQDAAERSDAMLLIRGKTRFERPDGSIGKSPGDGVTLWAAGDRAGMIIHRAGPRLGVALARTIDSNKYRDGME